MPRPILSTTDDELLPEESAPTEPVDAALVDVEKGGRLKHPADAPEPPRTPAESPVMAAALSHRSTESAAAAAELSEVSSHRARTAHQPGARCDSAFDEEGRLPPFPVPWRHPLRCVAWILTTLFGLASLVFMLGVLAAVPVLNFVTLGYLLEVEGRIARTGQLRGMFPLLNLAPRVGMIALGIYLWTVPLRLLARAAADAAIIDPGGSAARRVAAFAIVAWGAVTVHLCLALARGGTLGCFLRPIKNFRWLMARLRDGDYLSHAAFHVSDFLAKLELQRHFWLGVRGFFVALIWLAIPSGLYAGVRSAQSATPVVPVIGAILLVLVLSWMPFLQARFAAEDRFMAGFELGAIRRLFAYAPFAWLAAVVVTYVLVLPLYLFKAFSLPKDAVWPITLIYVATIYPTRVVSGWAYHRALSRAAQGWRSWWTTRLVIRVPAMLALLSLYVFILYFTQFLGEHGRGELLKHHAFMLPWPYSMSLSGE